MNAFVKGCDDLRQEYFPGATIVVVRHTPARMSNAERAARSHFSAQLMSSAQSPKPAMA